MKPKNTLKYLVIAATALFAAGCVFDENPLQQRLADIASRIEALQGRIDAQNGQIASLAELLGGNVITSMEDQGDRYVITYLDAKGQEKSVALARGDQMINSPILGVRKDDKGVYYWTVTAGGSTKDLLDESGNPIPVAGTAPVVSVNESGYWTVNGSVITYPDGTPVIADDGSSSVIQDVLKTENGDLQITLGNGQIVTLPMQKALNLKLNCLTINNVADISKAFEILYEAEGEAAASAIVDIADVENLSAEIDREQSRVSVTFPENFQNGRLVLFAYDMENTVIRPLFFEKAAESTITISDAAQLRTFASRVNARDGAERMEIILAADIDLGGESWTPIGNGTVASDGTVSGAAFKGVFKGQGHVIDNFRVELASAAPEGSAAGLFGVLDGASISNLTIGSSASVASASANSANCGCVAGFALNSTLENCRNEGSVCVTAVSDKVRETAGGIVGSICTGMDNQTLLKGCVNAGRVTSVNTVNTGNGATGLSVGGIVGFADGTAYSVICSCTNSADISAQATRLAGICASANAYVKVESCTNNGNISDTDVTADNTRVAGICSAASTETYFTSCVNMGDICYAVSEDQAHGYAAGILGQANNALAIDGCENYGAVLSDIYKSPGVKYLGIICANLNDKAVSVKNCKLGGRIGPYTEDAIYIVVTLNEVNYGEYLTMATSKAGSAVCDNNTFAGSAPAGITNLADLKEFRDSVNAGKTYRKFTSSDGSVKLLADIDMSGEASWEPIGNPATCNIATNYAMECTGNVFTGVFDGNGHTIRNFTPTVDVASGKVFGLFGAVVGGTVKTLTMGQAGDSTPLVATSEGLAAISVLAGVVKDGSIIDCTNYTPFEFGGSRTDNVRVTCGLFAGMINATKENGTGLSGLVNYGNASVKAGSNTKNGATGVHFGAITGFSTGTQNQAHLNTIENCTNYGDISATVGRSSGIAAASPSNTIMRYCVNRGNQVNDFVNARVGNMTCIMGVRGVMDDCTNYGNITTSDASTTAGAMIALINDATVVMTGGANYGTIICANSQYHGLMVANVSKCASIDGFYVAGACGTYSPDGNHQMHEITQSNWMSHIGYVNASYTSKVTNLSSKWGDAPTGELPDLKDAKLRILFIGNSFTKDAVEHLPGMLGAAGITDITLAHCYYGGRLVPEYYNGWKTTSDYTLYYKNPGESVWTTHGSKVNLKKVAESGRWDIITIQEHTGNKVAWSWTADEKTAVQGLLDYCVATQTTTPKTYYILSQVYYNMAKIGTGSQPYITWTDQAGMYDVLVAQGKKVKDETTYTGILSTCTYLQNLRTSSINIDNGMGLTRDGYHMDYGITRYGAACLMFESLITPVFGTTMDGNTYRYTKSSTSETAYSTPTTDENIPYALSAARYAMEKPFEITDMSSK